MLSKEELNNEAQRPQLNLDLSAMDPLQKAALLLVTLDQQYALSLIHLLKKEEVKEMFNCLDQDTVIPMPETEVLVGDFYEFLVRHYQALDKNINDKPAFSATKA